MTNELSKRLVCILMRSRVEIWKEEDRINKINLEGVKFINIDGEIINTADISGIFKASTMEEQTRRKNGEWKCQQNYWHNRGEKCEKHPAQEETDNKEVNILMLKIDEARKVCSKCVDGFVGDEYCGCVSELVKELNQYGKTLLKK